MAEITNTAAPIAYCWICGSVATSGEHRTKRSDLRALFGTPNQRDPFYFHDAARRNKPVGSLDAKVLKYSKVLCERCNNARTQPHDLAWQDLSGYLRARIPPLAAGDTFRPNRVFPYDTRRAMLNVHLYWVKQFGCAVAERSIPIDLAPFSRAILDEGVHPNLLIAFGPSFEFPVEHIGASDMETAMFAGKCVFATWFHYIGRLAVNIVYAADGESREGMRHAWHPRFGTKRLVLKEFGGHARADAAL
jgi:hypothetical protein